MARRRSLLKERKGSAAAELALILPLLLMLMFSGLEVGNYFMNEHTLVKAVRNGARFAGRQSFTNYTGCSGSPGGSVVADTQAVVMRGYSSATTIITPNINAGDVTVTTSCATTAGGQTFSGIYAGRTTGAQVVIVTANVEYQSVVAATFGFNVAGLTLNAASQATVAGL